MRVKVIVFFYGWPSDVMSACSFCCCRFSKICFERVFFWHFRVYFVWLGPLGSSRLSPNINWKEKTKIPVIIYVWLNGKMYFTFPVFQVLGFFFFKGHRWWLSIHFVFDWLYVWPKILSILNYIQSIYFISKHFKICLFKKVYVIGY
jgi:hypothetical protein